MTQKEFILRVLKLFPNWEMWRWIKAMVQNNQLEEDTLNRLVIVFKQALDEINSVIKENKMLETIHAVKQFDAQKEAQAQQDKANLAKLDSLLDNF